MSTWSPLLLLFLSLVLGVQSENVYCICEKEHCDWFDVHTWSSRRIPTGEDNVYIDAKDSLTVVHIGEWYDLSHQTVTVKSLYIGHYNTSMSEKGRGPVVLDSFGTLTVTESVVIDRLSALSLSMPFRELLESPTPILITSELLVEEEGHIWVAGGGRIHAIEFVLNGKMYIRRDGVYSIHRAEFAYGKNSNPVYIEPVVIAGAVLNESASEYEDTLMVLSASAEVHLYVEVLKENLYATPLLHSYATLSILGHVNWNSSQVILTLWPLSYSIRGCQRIIKGHLIQPHSCFAPPTAQQQSQILKYSSRTGNFQLQQRNFCDDRKVQWWLGDYTNHSTMEYLQCADDPLLEFLYRSASAFGPDCQGVPFVEITSGDVLIGDYFNLTAYTASASTSTGTGSTEVEGGLGGLGGIRGTASPRRPQSEISVVMLPVKCRTHADCSNGICNFDVGQCLDCSTFSSTLVDDWDANAIAILNFSDSSAYCGGPYCPETCSVNERCMVDGDCVPGFSIFCHPEQMVCVERCENTEFDEGETDVDCGGVCSPCLPGSTCNRPSDCRGNTASLFATADCIDNICISCDDGIQNGNETGVDCGGSFCHDRCPLGSRCLEDTDCRPLGVGSRSECKDGICQNASCPFSEFSGVGVSMPLTRTEKQSERGLTGDFMSNPIDTGDNETAAVCFLECLYDSDCGEEVCVNNTCQSICNNGILDVAEADLDCGRCKCNNEGDLCPLCENGRSCRADDQCVSNACVSGRCEGCNDNKRSGLESDVDCGNSKGCNKCGSSKWCRTSFDCDGVVDNITAAGMCSMASASIIESVACVENRCVSRNYECSSCLLDSCNEADFKGPSVGCLECGLYESCVATTDCIYPLVCIFQNERSSFGMCKVADSIDDLCSGEYPGPTFPGIGNGANSELTNPDGGGTTCTNQESGGLAVVYGDQSQTCEVTCPTGWEGANCDIPRCFYSTGAGYMLSSDPLEYCGGVGDCSTLTDPPSCQCDENHRGTACEILDCPGSPDCGGTHGDCTDAGCICTSLWDGVDCLTPDCPGEPDCGGAGVGSCSTSGGDPHCICSSPYVVGDDCGLRCNPDETCSGRGQCTETSSGVAECVCFDASTYYGDSCQHRFCKPDNTCGGHGTCNQASGICECDSDWYGDACEYPDCTGGNGDSGAQQCSGHGTCQYLVGSVQCVCASSSTTSFSWTESDCSQPTCGSVPCSGNGECLDTGGNYPVCSCFDGFSDTLCEKVVLPDVCPDDCNGRGECVDSGGGRKVCECQSDFTGSSCGIPYCGETPCSGNGECIAVENSAVCECDAGYGGSDCSNLECPENCSGRGNCVAAGSGALPQCDCDSLYSGDDCGECLRDEDSVTLKFLVRVLDSDVDNSEVLNTIVGVLELQSYPLCKEMALSSTASRSTALMNRSKKTTRQSLGEGIVVLSAVLPISVEGQEHSVVYLFDNFLRDHLVSVVDSETSSIGEVGRWELMNMERSRPDQSAICPENCNGENGRCLYDGSCLCTQQYSDTDCSSPVCPEGEAVREGENSIKLTCTGRGNCSLGQAIYYEGFSTPILFPNTCECPIEWDGVACESAGAGSCVDDCNFPNGVCDLMGSAPVCVCVSPYIGDACNESLTDTVTTTLTTGKDAHWIKWTMVGLLCAGAVALILITVLYYRSSNFVRLVKGSDGARIQKLRSLEKSAEKDEKRSLKSKSSNTRVTRTGEASTRLKSAAQI